MSIIRRITTSTMTAAIAISSVGLFAAGSADAATVSGWTGPAGSTGYLHNSTIINSPNLTAESKIWQVVGSSIGAGKIGARARLFKSGALCEAVDYEYNFYSATEWAVRTTNTCGSGSYNSHGFVAVWNEATSTYGEYLTFPSNPLSWKAPSTATSRSVAPPTVSESDRATGVNTRGQRFGSADTDGTKGEDLDLVLAIATNAKVGYVKSSDLERPLPKTPAAAVKSNGGQRTIPVFAKDGTSTIGQFTVK